MMHCWLRDSRAQQEKFFKANMGFIAPEQVQIGTKFVVKTTKDNKRAMCCEAVVGYYVPFMKSLESLLKHNGKRTVSRWI